MKSVMVVVATRPEIIKMAPLIRVLEKKALPFTFVHCGQHYDYNMSQQFIEELGLPTPDYGYKIKAHSQGLQTARIMVCMERIVGKLSQQLFLLRATLTGYLQRLWRQSSLEYLLGTLRPG